MASERRCPEVEARLAEAWLARQEASEEDRRHAASCPTCGTALAELRALGEALEAQVPPEPAEALVAATLARARAELAAPGARAPARLGPEPLPARRALPAGFGRECLRLLGGAMAPLPVVLLWNVTLLFLGARWLSGWIPGPLLELLGVAYGMAVAGWLALLYGSIPLLAHRRLRQSPREVTP